VYIRVSYIQRISVNNVVSIYFYFHIQKKLLDFVIICTLVKSKCVFLFTAILYSLYLRSENPFYIVIYVIFIILSQLICRNTYKGLYWDYVPIGANFNQFNCKCTTNKILMCKLQYISPHIFQDFQLNLPTE